MAYPRYQLSRAHRFVNRNSGNLTLNSASWADLAAAAGGPGAGEFDLTVEAQEGDVLVALMNAVLASTTPATYIDPVTVVGGVATNSFGRQGAVDAGLAGQWYAPASMEVHIGQAVLYEVTASDIESGKVKVRPRYIQAAASARVLFASFASGPTFQFAVYNIGPQDPE